MTDLQTMGEAALVAKASLQRLTSGERNRALLHGAEKLLEKTEEILAANGQDMENAEKNQMRDGLKDRLRLTKERIGAMAEGLRQVAGLPDCIGPWLR